MHLLFRAALQAVAEQLHGLLTHDGSGTAAVAAATETAAAADSEPGPGSVSSDAVSCIDSCNGSGSATSSSRYSITCHPHIPAVLVGANGPHAVDLSAGEGMPVLMFSS